MTQNKNYILFFLYVLRIFFFLDKIYIENLYITHKIIFYKIFKNTYGLGHALFKYNNAFLTEVSNERQT